MTKKFCDLCGKPAVELSELSVQRAHGPTYLAPTIGGGSTHTCAKIQLAANIRFIDHPSGYGGAPDLCADCVYSLLDDLARTLIPRCTSGDVRGPDSLAKVDAALARECAALTTIAQANPYLPHA